MLKPKCAIMQRYRQIVSAAAAVLAWVAPANAAPPEPDGEIAGEAGAPASASWILIDARDHARGASGAAAVLFGVAQERGRSRQASLRVACFDGVTTVNIDTAALRPGASAVAVMYSLDGGPFRPAAWQAGADGNGLDLSAERAIAFVAELYGKAELRLALSGAEQSLGSMAERCQWSAAPAISEAGRR